MSVCLQCETLPYVRDRKLQSSSVTLLVLGRRGATGLYHAETLIACGCECFEPSRGSMGTALLQYKRNIWPFFKTGLEVILVAYLVINQFAVCRICRYYRSARKKQVVAGGLNMFYSQTQIV